MSYTVTTTAQDLYDFLEANPFEPVYTFSQNEDWAIVRTADDLDLSSGWTFDSHLFPKFQAAL